MSNKNRTEFTKRIQTLTPTHDMKALKDPATQHMKGERRKINDNGGKKTRKKLAAGSSHLFLSLLFSTKHHK
jgi:hypothetical protein